MPIRQLFVIAMVVCFVVAVVSAAIKSEYKSSGAWFFTGYALAALILTGV